MDFGDAMKAMKLGEKVYRENWNGANMFAYYVPGGNYPAQMNAIKGIFDNDLIPYRPYLALKTAQNDVATWTPSGSDCIAEDWRIKE